MTTRITIKHEGPDTHNVKIADVSPGHTATRIIKTGQSSEHYVYGGRSVEVSETDEPATSDEAK